MLQNRIEWRNSPRAFAALNGEVQLRGDSTNLGQAAALLAGLSYAHREICGPTQLAAYSLRILWPAIRQH